MKETLLRFWKNLLSKLDESINQYLNKDRNKISTVDADDDTVVNFFVMILKKVINRALMGAEYNIISDSTQTEPLAELCKNINENIYKIAGNMLSAKPYAECWCVPSFVTVGGKQKLIHSYVDGSRIRITSLREDGQISECYMILNATKRKNKEYFLCRKHQLDDIGNLTISYFVMDSDAKEIMSGVLPEWDNLVQVDVIYPLANHIGFGRYKSPVESFNDSVYGVPLNHNCGFIEKQLEEAVKNIESEMKASKKMLFPDWSLVKKTDENGNPIGMYSINEHIFPIKKRAGESGNLIEDYCPSIRGTEYEEHLTRLLERYQNLMGVSELITHNRTTSGATATEIKMLNTDNLSLEHAIQKSIRKGNIETLEADGIYLGIARDLWEYDEDYTDIYVDADKELDKYIKMYDTGAIELSDLVRYWNPTYSEEQIKEKVAAINEAKANNTQKSIEELLNI